MLILTLSFNVFAQTEKKDALKLYNTGKYTEAVEVCKQEIDENPKNLDSYVVLCWALNSSQQYREADFWCEKGRAISKYDPRLIEAQAEAKFNLNENDVSLSLFQEYISLIPTGNSRFGIAYYYMGELYIRLGKFNHADIALTTAVNTEPTRSFWWARLGYAREKATLYKLSLEAYNQALALSPYLQDALNGKQRVLNLM